MVNTQDNVQTAPVEDAAAPEAFADPVAYLRRWGIDAELVAPAISLPAAA